MKQNFHDFAIVKSVYLFERQVKDRFKDKLIKGWSVIS